jgi:hypothetical protein
MAESHGHPKSCPDQKAAAADRKEHEARLLERQRLTQIAAHAEWFDWKPEVTPK